MWNIRKHAWCIKGGGKSRNVSSFALPHSRQGFVQGWKTVLRILLLESVILSLRPESVGFDGREMLASRVLWLFLSDHGETTVVSSFSMSLPWRLPYTLTTLTPFLHLGVEIELHVITIGLYLWLAADCLHWIVHIFLLVLQVVNLHRYDLYLFQFLQLLKVRFHH